MRYFFHSRSIYALARKAERRGHGLPRDVDLHRVMAELLIGKTTIYIGGRGLGTVEDLLAALHYPPRHYLHDLLTVIKWVTHDPRGAAGEL